MGINDNGGRDIYHSPKKAQTSDDGEDFISNLPDPILVHILSFLPIKGAINAVLLHRFGNLWRSIQVLDFDSCLYDDHDYDDEDLAVDYFNENFMDVICHVLSLHDSPTLDKLCLKFGFTVTCSNDNSVLDVIDEYWEREIK